jgi:hypothetical protein
MIFLMLRKKQDDNWIIICPVCAYPAMHHGTSFEMFPAFSYAMTYNLTGWSAVVVRARHFNKRIAHRRPQIVARPWRDDVALAKHIEKVLGGLAASTALIQYRLFLYKAA